MKANQVRQTFIDFFKSKEHHFAPPAPVVIYDDPTLLFTNAGMNQFKDMFLGTGKREYTRAVNSQASIRVSGKHNDLEEVGKDTYHFTLFEMLGNWSFGDYGKKEAIVWAWELLTEVYKLPKDKLYATVYKTDDEAALFWEDVTDINPAHILRFGAKDNFWEMGKMGPCGPSSELHIDRGQDACDRSHVDDHTCKVNGNCARYIELWNLVFIQQERLKNGQLKDLPQMHIDTGAGLERISAYLQGVVSAYETDLFKPILDKVVELSGQPYKDGPQGMPHRVMADHIRTLCFAISDNVMPSNEGHGYVLRRILRRAMRYASQLGFNEPVMYLLVEPVIEVMGGYFENLVSRKDFIETVIKAEEESFLKTLETGTQLFNQIVAEQTSHGEKLIGGEQAFKLYDTYGFPIDLTQI